MQLVGAEAQFLKISAFIVGSSTCTWRVSSVDKIGWLSLQRQVEDGVQFSGIGTLHAPLSCLMC